MERRLLDALVLTFWNFAPSKRLVKDKAAVDATGYVVSPVVILYCNGSWYGSMVVYIHIGVGSALLVSTNRAMRRPQNVRRVTGTGSHAFLF